MAVAAKNLDALAVKLQSKSYTARPHHVPHSSITIDWGIGFGLTEVDDLRYSHHQRMSQDNLILASTSSFGLLTISDPPSKFGFGYNPAVGPASNAILSEATSIIVNRKLIALTPTSSASIYDRSVTTKKPHEINLLALSFLFCEIVNWTHRSSRGIQDLETRLNGLGYPVGQKLLELVKLREGPKSAKREIKTIEFLQFIHGPLWRAAFGKMADALEKSQDVPGEYMIIDNVPLVLQFISIPPDYGNLNCAAFIAGIIEGALDSASFNASVTAHSVPLDGSPLRTVFLIKFDDLVCLRETLRG